MQEEILAVLTAKADKAACALTDKMVAESCSSNRWYTHFDEFAALLTHPKSLVRNRALILLAVNARWDTENRLDAILPALLTHITDEKPITARQCIKALAKVGQAKPQYIPAILAGLKQADFSGYKDSMRPLLERDAAETQKVLRGLR